jgi:hypothetical protein
MKRGFYNASATLGIAFFLGSGAVLADPAVDKSTGLATSLNDTVSGGSGHTTVGNPYGVTLDGNTTVTGDLSASGNSTLGTAGNSTNTISGQTTTIDSTNNTIGASGSTNAINGTSTAINSTNNTISGQTTNINSTESVDIDTKKATITGSTSVMATVNSGQSVLAGGQTTTSQMSIGNIGQQGARVDANGKVTMGALDQSTAALTVTNGQGNTHGFVVNETSATMSGGTTSTSLTLNDGGARFSNASSGGPVRVTGVADGRHDYDAVNYRQLKSVKAGIAGIAAMTNIPQVEQYKKFALGLGLGRYDGVTSMAIGASARLSENAIVKASVSNGIAGGGSRKSTVYGIGAGFSW